MNPQNLTRLEPTEEAEQMALFEWAQFQSGKYPELLLLLHIPNGGKRTKAQAGRFKAMGVKAGVPDLFLPMPRANAHGLWIELKRLHKSSTTSVQRQWHQALIEQGYFVRTCHGWEQAATSLLDYLNQS